MARRAGWQLFDAGTSVGANYQEARSASSKRDFLARQDLGLRESRECYFWLRLIAATKLGVVPSELLREASELIASFRASTRKLETALPDRWPR